MPLPTNEQIEQLHRKYAPTSAVLDLVYTHCKIVCDIAVQLLPNYHGDIDRELVRVGCLLHDIGVYTFFGQDGQENPDRHYITHGIRGEEILRNEGFPEIIWRFASHHTGVGLTIQDITAGNLPLPQQDYLAETPEERLVMYADKFHSKTTPPYLNPYDWYKQYVAKFGQDKVVLFEHMAQEFGIPDLAPLVKQYGHQERPTPIDQELAR